MKRLRQARRSLSGLLLSGAVLFQVSFLPAQAPSASSGQAITIAVLDFDGFGISQTEAIALSNRLRNELFRLGTFEVVDRGMMENILGEQDFQQAGCTSNECLVEVGRLLGAQQMVGGSVSKVGQTFSVSARVVDVETGKVLSVSDFDQRGEIDDMLTRGMREVAVRLSDSGIEQEALVQEGTEQNSPLILIQSGTKRVISTAEIGITEQHSNRKSIFIGISYYFPTPFNIRKHSIYPALSFAYSEHYRRYLTSKISRSLLVEGHWRLEKEEWGLSLFTGIGEGYTFRSTGTFVASMGFSVYQKKGSLFFPPILMSVRTIYESWLDRGFVYINLGFALYTRRG